MILIIGYGNSLRRDDGAGLVLAEILEQEWNQSSVQVKRIAVHQLMPELALEIAQESVTAVVFVDTHVSNPDQEIPNLFVHPLTAANPSSSLGHHLNPATLLTYVKLLYYRDLPAWLVTVPGIDFDHGEGLSSTARQAIETAPEALADLWAELRQLQN